jgi:hypothetical protein
LEKKNANVRQDKCSLKTWRRNGIK